MPACSACFEATRGDVAERNRLGPANTLPDSLPSWARKQGRHSLATRAFTAEPDIAAWANAYALNPARVEPSQRDEPSVQAATARLAHHAASGLARLSERGGEPLPAGAGG